MVRLVAYVALTLMGVTVAATNAFITFRNNYGWKPLFLVTGHGLKSAKAEGHFYEVTLTMEFWNRRTYPLVVRAVHLNFEGLKFDVPVASVGNFSGWRYNHRGEADYTVQFSVGEKQHHSFDFEAPIPEQSLDALDNKVKITAYVFDPLSGKAKPLTIHHRYKLSGRRRGYWLKRG